MLWDINVIPNEQDNGYLMLPPGVLHMSALGRFGRFTLFSPRVSHSKHLPCSFCFVLCFGFGVFVALLCFCFLFCKCFGIPNSPCSLDLDDRQGLIASSAMQQKKMDRYVGAMQGPDSPLEVNVRGFSAGSYSGLAFLHILWSIPRVSTKGFLGAIACPPSLLNMSRAKKGDLLHLIHFESDSLCSWKPGLQQIRDCCTSFTYVTNEIASYKGHFGPDEHDYSHWMALNLPNGSITLRVLLFIRPEAASKARRDAGVACLFPS